MPSSSHHQPRTFWEWFDQNVKFIFVALTAVAAGALVMMAVNGAPHAPANAVAGPIPTFSSQPAPAEQKQPTVAESMKLLDDVARPFVLTVLGDSTGNGDNEWVYLTAGMLSKKYDRPVVINNWSETENKYISTKQIGGGANAPVTIWNSSASGKGLDYALATLPAASPVQPDLVIVNHGHNMSNAAQAAQKTQQLLAAVNAQWKTRPAIAITLQNPRTDATASVQDEVVAALRAQFTDGRYTLIDVYSSYQKSDLAKTLSTDGRHPTDAGSAIWASDVAHALGLEAK